MVSENPKTTAYDEERLLRRIDELIERSNHLEKELARSHRLALLGTLVGTIAHEFNNLLTPVMSYAQLALHDLDDKDLVVKALEKSLNTTDKAANIASALLGFSREGTGEASCPVQAALDEALVCMARTPEKDGIRFETDIQEGICAAIQPISLQQVLLNLLLNASKAVRPRHGLIRVSAACSTWNIEAPERKKQGACVVLRVEDTGRGIPEDSVGKVFEPFYTGFDLTDPNAGCGLGLTICKRLIEDAGGTISVASTEGEGTTFTILLDLDAAASNEQSTDRSAA